MVYVIIILLFLAIAYFIRDSVIQPINYKKKYKSAQVEIKQLKNELVNVNLGHVKEWKELNERLELAMAQNYCTICGHILDGYVPPKKDKADGL